MTFTEQKTLDFLAAMRERIESGAVRIIAADVGLALGDCMERLSQLNQSGKLAGVLEVLRKT